MLDDTYLLNVIMKSAFSSTTRDPMNFSTFVDLISSILQEALVFKTAAIAPYGVIQLDSKLDSNFDEAGVRLPSGWTRHYDDDKKMEYYQNAETGCNDICKASRLILQGGGGAHKKIENIYIIKI